MPSYLKNKAAAYGCIEELKFDQVAPRVCTPGRDIAVIVKMPQMGITMKMKAGVILGQQLAVKADRFLEIHDETCSL